MIELVKVKGKDEGQIKAHDVLKKIVDSTTLLALSGGTSMDYKKMLVQAGDIIPGAICVVDERYGEPFHKDSNEKLLLDQGVKKFADEKCIESHKILAGLGFEETGKKYSDTIQDLIDRFPKRVGVMGVGTNLHTAGIFPYSVSARSPHFVESEIVEDEYPKRISMTLKALGEFTNFVIMMFGSTKRDALKIMLDEKENDMQKYPAIFYRKAPTKSYLVTDIDL